MLSPLRSLFLRYDYRSQIGNFVHFGSDFLALKGRPLPHESLGVVLQLLRGRDLHFFFLRRLRPQQLHVHGSHDCRARDDDEVDFTEDRFSSFNVVVGYFGQANCMNDGCRYA